MGGKGHVPKYLSTQIWPRGTCLDKAINVHVYYRHGFLSVPGLLYRVDQKESGVRRADIPPSRAGSLSQGSDRTYSVAGICFA
jgi:hypothetical protein